MSFGNTNSVFRVGEVQFYNNRKLVSGDIDYMNGLVDGRWRWGDGSNTDGSVTQVIGFHFQESSNANPNPPSIWNPDGTTFDQQLAVVEAMQLWANVANIRFEQQSAVDAEILLLNTTKATIANFSGFSGTPVEAGRTEPTETLIYDKVAKTTVYIPVATAGQVATFIAGQDGVDFTQLSPAVGWGPDTPARYTIMHEIGHALGLKHPHERGPSNFSLFPGATGENVLGPSGLNTALYTAMSYNRPDKTYKGFAETPMALDVAAIQLLYGANTTYNNGNNTYELPNPTSSTLPVSAGGNWGQPGKTYYSIWDTGGTDEVVYNGSADATIDLRPATLAGKAADGAGGFLSFTKGKSYGLGFTIAGDITNALADVNGVTGVIIENATGGSGKDTITGNDVANSLNGRDGDDTLHGNGGNDLLYGGLGKDRLYGGAGNDSYFLLDPFKGSYDTASDSGGGHDTIYLNVLPSGPKSYLLQPGFEDAIIVQAFADGFTLTGNISNNVLHGADYRQTLNGGGGNDTLNGFGGLDTLIGGKGDDTYILGSATEGSFDTPGSYDIVTEAANAGEDTVWVRKDPSSGVGFYQLANNVENGKILDELQDPADGSFDLRGNDLNNRLWGGVGGDILSGGFGSDHFYGNDDALNSGGTVDFNPHTPVNAPDQFYGGVGNDTYYLYEVDALGRFSIVNEELNEGYDVVRVKAAFTGSYYANQHILAANVEDAFIDSAMGVGLAGNGLDNVLTGNAGNDGLTGQGGDDTLIGMAGYDDLRGGDGDDNYYIDMTETGGGLGRWDWDVIVEDNTPDSGIDTVYVQAGAPNPLFTHDDYQLADNVERGFVTSGEHFWLVGNGLENSLFGNTGNDWLHGLDGNDVLSGSFGNDELIGGDGNDTLLGGSGRDTIWGDGQGTGFTDTFLYAAASDSGVGIANRDIIMDFQGGVEAGDKIDLSAIDPNSKLKSDQAFIFIDEAEFSSDRRKKVYGELRVENDEGFSVLQADLNGDGIADFEIAFDRVIDFTRDDFIL